MHFLFLVCLLNGTQNSIICTPEILRRINLVDTADWVLPDHCRPQLADRVLWDHSRPRPETESSQTTADLSQRQSPPRIPQTSASRWSPSRPPQTSVSRHELTICTAHASRLLSTICKATSVFSETIDTYWTFTLAAYMKVECLDWGCPSPPWFALSQSSLPPSPPLGCPFWDSLWQKQGSSLTESELSLVLSSVLQGSSPPLHSHDL